MQRRLLESFAAVRNEAPQLKWTFVPVTNNGQTWSEETPATKGMPPAWITLITVDLCCSFTGQPCSGFLTTHRTLSPRKATRNIQLEAKSLVAARPPVAAQPRFERRAP